MEGIITFLCNLFVDIEVNIYRHSPQIHGLLSGIFLTNSVNNQIPEITQEMKKICNTIILKKFHLSGQGVENKFYL